MGIDMSEKKPVTGKQIFILVALIALMGFIAYNFLFDGMLGSSVQAPTVKKVQIVSPPSKVSTQQYVEENTRVVSPDIKKQHTYIVERMSTLNGETLNEKIAALKAKTRESSLKAVVINADNNSYNERAAIIKMEDETVANKDILLAQSKKNTRLAAEKNRRYMAPFWSAKLSYLDGANNAAVININGKPFNVETGTKINSVVVSKISTSGVRITSGGVNRTLTTMATFSVPDVIIIEEDAEEQGVL
jgi:hypothetical protein